MNVPCSRSAVLLFFLLAVFPYVLFTAPGQGQDALFAALDAGTPANARAVLAAFADGQPVLRRCHASGVAYAVPHCLLKSRTAAQTGDIAGALRELRRADGTPGP